MRLKNMQYYLNYITMFFSSLQQFKISIQKHLSISPRHLQALVVAYIYFLVFFGAPTCLLITLYVLIYTNYKWLMLLYLIWMYSDRRTIETGGRRFNWYSDSKIWKHFRDYFPHTLKFDEGVQLDPNKNYLFCCLPHGVMPAGAYALCTNSDLFPNHRRHFLALECVLYIPILRDILLAQGGGSASANAINFLLNQEGGGNIAALMIGGASESQYSKAGDYVLYYENRKGFVKLALKAGAPIVPVFSFGEIDLFDQPNYSPIVRKIQDKFKSILKFALILPIGKGFLPFRKPLVTIVGKPLILPKIASPTQADIDEIHANFKRGIVDIFEKYKHKYAVNPDETKLIFI